jgi:hypothetical protein
MAIPTSVLLYTNWLSANLSGGVTYTTVAPEKPVGHVLTFDSDVTLGSGGGAPWLTGQEIADMDNHFSAAITSTLSAATAQASSGRIYAEFNPTTAVSQVFLRLEAATFSNGRVRIQINGAGNVLVGSLCTGGDGLVDLGTESANPYAVEIIYDTNNATRSQRLRARMWDLGGTPPAFSDNSDVASSAATTDQFTYLQVGDGGDVSTGMKSGRIAISNSITEDLSNLTEGSGGAAGPSLGARYLIGVWA